MTNYSPDEQAAYAQMQARLIALLLRHNERSFQRLYGAHSEYQREDHSGLQRYRDLAVLFYLRDELFEHILPRIVRRLSFESPRTVLLEEPPAQGRVDWTRTLDATWADQPGEPPLLLHTRQRRREFTTPENLLTVVTLLEYRDAVQHLLWNEHAVVGSEALRHPLNEIVERCEREPAFPQFAGLRQTAQQIIEGIGGDPESLEAQVQERLLPGSNSAYQELLDWRVRFRELQLLNRTPAQQPDDVLGADPARDNYLYQLWLFYEIGELLQQQNRLVAWDDGAMTLTFAWGDVDDQRTYCLQHDQSIKQSGAAWRPWRDAPGVRPDFYINHVDARSVLDPEPVGTIIWREPGYVLDAKYYRPRESAKAPGNPVKRMIADLQLSDERHGALLFAFQHDASELPSLPPDELERDARLEIQRDSPLYSVSPISVTAQHVQPDIRVGVWRVQPTVTSSEAALQTTLTGLIEHVHQALQERIEVRCHGVFLDTLTATAHGTLASVIGLTQRHGTPQQQPLDDLLICPKPHVGPWRFDLVSHTNDCCVNGSVCHIKYQADVRKPKRLSALEDITEAIRSVDGDADDDTVSATATQQVLTVTKRYAQLLQPNIEEYQAWIRDKLDVGDVFDTTSLLTTAQRETLALARFLWEQIDHIRATNYAGPTLLFTGVLEEVSRATIYRRHGRLTDKWERFLPDTLGTLGNSIVYDNAYNYRLLEQSIVGGGYWQAQIGPSQALPFHSWIERVLDLSKIRNEAAHQANVSPRQFRALTDMYFGSPRSGIGVFNGLLLAWQIP